jgi:hypothetical protein
MLVKELIEFLQHCPPNDIVCIGTEATRTTMGGQPNTNIKSVTTGFDWDSGKTFINPEFMLWRVNPEDKTVMKNLNDRIGWCEYEKSGLKTQINQLKRKIKDE